MATRIEQLRAAVSEATGAYSAKLGAYSDDAPPTHAQSQELDALRQTMTSAINEMRAAESFSTDRRSWAEQEATLRQSGGAASGVTATLRPGEERDVNTAERLASLGMQFVQNPDYQSWLRTIAPNGNIPDSVKGLHSPTLPFKAGYASLDQRAALMTGASDTSGGAFVNTQHYPGLTELGRRELSIRDIITVLTTDSDTVDYVRVTSETNNAAPVAEATATSGGNGVKPESGLTFERVSTAVKTIAHWIPATKRALSDAGQLRGLIDEFLRYGLDEELEDQILLGDGTGENFTGILNVSGTQAQAWVTDRFVTTRQARRKVRTIGRRRPKAYIMNPEDWELFELERDAEQRFYGNGPWSLTTPTLWGLPVIESEAMPVGTGLVGDFATCVLWDRQQATMSATDSHADFFIRNLVAILCELRAAFGVLKPNALVEIDLTA